eukprot:2655467-Prorocentrum_lima.AAC.1
MTSSLVGSEMCIRDRASLNPVWKGLEPEKTRRPNPVDLNPSPKAQSRPCLLYTSDAADDM